MQKFMEGKWRIIEQTRRFTESYGDNANLVKRFAKALFGGGGAVDNSKKDHFLGHLFGKNFKVKQLVYPRFDVKVSPRYLITEHEKFKARQKRLDLDRD